MVYRVERPTLPFDSVKFELSEGREGEVVRTRAGKITLTSDQEVIGIELLRLLNRSVHHDGSWRVVWCDPTNDFWNKPTGIFMVNIPERVEFQWIDSDGDPIFKVDSEDKPWLMLETGISYYRDCCEEAWQKAFEFRHTVVGIKPHQTFQQAAGQKLDHAYQDAPELA